MSLIKLSHIKALGLSSLKVLNWLCHEDIAVLDQLCAVVITNCLNPYKNQIYFFRDGSTNNYSQLFFGYSCRHGIKT